MSAYEIWTCEFNDGYVEAQATPIPPATIRYLRADLTCGECAKQYTHTKGVPDCAKLDSDAFDEYNESVAAYFPDQPACMAFTPKEQP